MNKSEFKYAVKNSIPIMWMNIKNQQLYAIVGVDKSTFDDDHWDEKPINILYLDKEESEAYKKIKNDAVYLYQIELKEKLFPNIKRHESEGAIATKDESIIPNSNKIANN
jgi:hypothetical protein